VLFYPNKKTGACKCRHPQKKKRGKNQIRAKAHKKGSVDNNNAVVSGDISFNDYHYITFLEIVNTLTHLFL